MKRTPIIVILTIAVIVSLCATSLSPVRAQTAQTPAASAYWIRHLRGAGNDVLSSDSVVATADGGYTVAGGYGGRNFPVVENSAAKLWVGKFSATHRLQWMKTFEESTKNRVDDLIRLVLLPDGGYLVAYQGYSGSSTVIIVIRLSDKGDLLWQKGYNSSTFGTISSVTTDGYVGLVLDERVAKLDVQSGSIVWTAKLTTYADRVPAAISPTSDNGFVVVGSMASVPTRKGYVLRLSSDGNIVWNKQFPGVFNNVVRVNNDQYVIGEVFGGLIKVSESGNVIWQRHYQDVAALGEKEAMPGMAPKIGLSDGSVIVVGTTATARPNFRLAYTAWVFKIDGDGSLVWGRRYGLDPSNPFPQTIVQAARDIAPVGNGFIVVASEKTTYGNVGGTFDDMAWLMSLDADGNIDGDCDYRLPSNITQQTVTPGTTNLASDSIQTTTVVSDVIFISNNESLETIVQCGAPFTNNPPTANAGSDIDTIYGDSVGLSASTSSDPDGDGLLYQWTQTGGPTVTLSNGNTVAPSFHAPTSTAVLTFTLDISDTWGLTGNTDIVVVNIRDKLKATPTPTIIPATITATPTSTATPTEAITSTATTSAPITQTPTSTPIVRSHVYLPVIRQ